jgi:hypothetical protein
MASPEGSPATSLGGIRPELSLGRRRIDPSREISGLETHGFQRLLEYPVLGERAPLTPTEARQPDGELKTARIVLVQAHRSQRHQGVKRVGRGPDDGYADQISRADDVTRRVLPLDWLFGWTHQAGGFEDRGVQNWSHLPLDIVTLTKRFHLRQREVRVRRYEVEVKSDQVSCHARLSR